MTNKDLGQDQEKLFLVTSNQTLKTKIVYKWESLSSGLKDFILSNSIISSKLSRQNLYYTSQQENNEKLQNLFNQGQVLIFDKAPS